MAMNRQVADLQTNFSVTGLRTAASAISGFAAGVRRAFAGVDGKELTKAGADTSRNLDRATKSANGLRAALTSVVSAARKAAAASAGLARSGLGTAGRVAGAGVVGAAVGGLVQGGVIGKAVSGNKEIADEIDLQSRIAKSIGMSIEQFSLFAAFGRRFKLEAQDLGAIMVQFSGVLNDAAKGEGAGAEWFEKMGIQAKDAAGNMRPILDVFNDVSRAAQRLTGAEKGAFMSAMFGEDDSVKASALVQALGSMDEQQWNDTAIGLARQGGIYTEEDVRNAELYRITLEQLADAWRKLKRAILAATGPQLREFFWVISRLVSENAGLIAGKLSVALGHLIRLAYDAILVFFGYQPVKNGWLATVGMAIRLAIQAVKDFIAFLPVALQFAKDAWYVLTFQDSKTSGENPGLFRLRAQIVNFGLWLADWAFKIADMVLFQIGLALGKLQVIALQVQIWLLEIKMAWETGFASNDSNFVARMIAEISQAIMWLQALKQSVQDVFLYDGKAQAGFEWMETIKRQWDEFSEKLGKAWEWFSKIFGMWEKLFAAFGIDLKTTLLFVGLLKLFNLLWLITLPLKVMGSLLIGFLSGLAQGLGAGAAAGAVGGGLAAMVGAIGKAIAGFGAACLAAMPIVAQFAVVAAAMFAAFRMGGEIGKFMAEFVNDFDGQIKGIASSMKANDEVYMRNKGLIDSAGQYTELARSQIGAAASSPALTQASSNPTSGLTPVNIYFDGKTDYPAEMYASQDAVRRLLTSDRFSFTGSF